MKTRRHAKILEIINEFAVDTQEELLSHLKNAGFDVTQATVSRDIKELRLIKALGNHGTYRYSTVKVEKESISAKFHSLFSDAVVNIDYAGNIVVVRCLPGMAQAACAALDAMQWGSVVGSLAGEDTFICITKDENRSVDLVTELKKMMKSGN